VSAQTIQLAESPMTIKDFFTYAEQQQISIPNDFIEKMMEIPN